MLAFILCVSATKQQEVGFANREKITITGKIEYEENQGLQSIPIQMHRLILAYLIGTPSHWVYLQTCRAIHSAYTADVFASHLQWFQTISTCAFYRYSETVQTLDDYMTFYKKMLTLSMYFDQPRLFVHQLVFSETIHRPLLQVTKPHEYALFFSSNSFTPYPTAKYNVRTNMFASFLKQRKEHPLRIGLTKQAIQLPLFIVLGRQNSAELKIEELTTCSLFDLDDLALPRGNTTLNIFSITFQSPNPVLRYHFMYTIADQEYILQAMTFIQFQDGRMYPTVYTRTIMGYFKLYSEFSHDLSVMLDPWVIIKLEFINGSISFYEDC